MINGIPSFTLLPTPGTILTCYRETSIFLPFPLILFSFLFLSHGKYNERNAKYTSQLFQTPFSSTVIDIKEIYEKRNWNSGEYL